MNARLDVAAYIRSRSTSLDEMQLQKLLYFSQGWCLAWRGRGLIRGAFEAWRYGPVDDSVWRAYRAHHLGDPEMLSVDDRTLIDAVLDFYGHLSGRALSDLTHGDGTPWKVVRRGLPDYMGSRRPIPDTAIRGWFVEESLSGHEQPRRPKDDRPASTAAALEVAAQQAARWRETLDELATR